VNSIGICQFGYASYPIDTWTSFYGAITGQEVTWEDALKLGERIGNLRLAFNLREGINPLLDHKVPDVVVGSPPLEVGNLRGVTVDVQRQVSDYLEAAGWDPDSCTPRRSKLAELGLDFVARDLAAVG
jgi:aldehyde:ferredoxin oxidoreductase